MAGHVYNLPIELRLLVDVVATRLQTLDQLDVHIGEVPDRIPTDPDGRVLPYAVIWPNLPAPAADGADLADSHLDRDWSLQVTVAAGWHNTLLDRADQVHQHLHRWAPSYDTPAGPITCSGFRVPPGYQPAIQIDRDTTPPRHYVPLQYRTTATT